MKKKKNTTPKSIDSWTLHLTALYLSQTPTLCVDTKFLLITCNKKV